MVPRLVLRMLLDRETYADFCSTVRKINVQPQCGWCNNYKATRVVDLRDKEMHDKLLASLERFGILDEVVFEDPEEFRREALDAKRRDSAV